MIMLSVGSNNRVVKPLMERAVESLATAPSNLSVDLMEPKINVTNVRQYLAININSCCRSTLYSAFM